MRIVFVLPAFHARPPGGARAVYEYAGRLAAAGHGATVLHGPLGEAPGDGSLRARLRSCAVDTRVRLAYAPALRSDDFPEADAVLATFWTTAEAVLRLPPSKGLKCHLIQGYETWGGPKRRVDAAWRMPTLKLVNAPWLLRKGLELGCPPGALRHVPPGLDHSVFRAQGPLPGRPCRVAMQYSSRPWKGGRDGLEALRRAKRVLPGLEAVLFGAEPRPRGLPAWISYRRDLSAEALAGEVYGPSAVYLCPSLSEGCPLPPMEAMACGCALVSTDIGGARAYAEHGRTALLSPPRRPAALAGNLVRAMGDERLRLRLAFAGMRRMRAFSWERSARRLLAQLRRLRGYRRAALNLGGRRP